MFMQAAHAFTFAEKITLGSVPGAVTARTQRGGVLATAQVETADGWCPAGALRVGMRVQTYDGGLCPILRLERQELSAGGALFIHVPGGALDNCDGLWLRPDQQILIASSVAEEVFDSAAVKVVARDLAGFRGIGPVWRPGAAAVITLGFAQNEAVFANTGTLLHFEADHISALSDFYPNLAQSQVAAMLALIEGGALSSADLRRAA